MTEGTPSDDISWKRIPKEAPVTAADGSTLGTTMFVLGDEDDDIFHGIALRPADGGKPRILLSSQISRLTTTSVATSLSPSDVDSLDPYVEEHWFHTELTGIFRKHVGWRQDD